MHANNQIIDRHGIRRIVGEGPIFSTGEEKRSSSASIGCLISPTGRTVIVREIGRANPLWKFPGGTSEEGETPKETLARELLEEVGIKIDTSKAAILQEETRSGKNYFPHFFGIKVSDEELNLVAKIGDEDGKDLEIKVVFIDEILTMPDFVKKHQDVIKRIVES